MFSLFYKNKKTNPSSEHSIFFAFLQIDFDDGNCPTFYNQIKGINNVCKVVTVSECYATAV